MVARAESAWAVALFGQPAYTRNAQALKHASPDAAKGGAIVLPAFGSFDTLNPYSLKGMSLGLASDQRAWGIDLANETLMAGAGDYLPSPDERMSAYCLICDTVEWDRHVRHVTFHLSRDARFHDGSAITSTDVVASYKLLTGPGAHPKFLDIFRDVTRVEALGTHDVRFSIKRGAGKAVILKLGAMPVMSDRFWQHHDFGKPLTDPPLLSGPYRVKSMQAGKQIVLERVPDFWSREHFYYRGQFNFDRVTYDFFQDRGVAFEAFKAGQVDVWMEYIAKNWASAYDFPALLQGDVVRELIPHHMPVTYQYFCMNLRRKPFRDKAFRDALALAFDFEWTNKYLFSGAYKRTTSYFPNSQFGRQGPSVSPRERAFASALKIDIPPDDSGSPGLESGGSRSALMQATRILKAAGYRLDNGALKDPSGDASDIEFIVDQPAAGRSIQPLRQNLSKLGIHSTLRVIDESQMKFRMDHRDFDVTIQTMPQALIPGSELRLYFHSSQKDVVGAYNYAGIDDPRLDKLVDAIGKASTVEDVKALSGLIDRTLLAENYTIPQWYLGYHRIAYKSRLHRVEPPPYNLGFTAWSVKI